MKEVVLTGQEVASAVLQWLLKTGHITEELVPTRLVEVSFKKIDADGGMVVQIERHDVQ